VLERLLSNVTELEIQTITSGGVYTYQVNAEVLMWLTDALKAYNESAMLIPPTIDEPAVAHPSNIITQAPLEQKTDDKTPDASSQAAIDTIANDADAVQAVIQANYREAFNQTKIACLSGCHII